MLILAVALSSLALSAPRDADLPTLTSALRTATSASPDGRARFAAARAGQATTTSVQVVVEADDAGSTAAALAALGGTVEVVTGELVQARVPYELLPAVGALPGVGRVREPWRPSVKDTPDVVSEGLGEIFDAGDWHAAGWTGRDVRVAVLDVGFSGYGDLLGTELPQRVSTEFASDEHSTRHGVAVAEVIHDIAPDADLVLVQFRTDAEYLAALERIAEIGVDVINASIGWDDVWHADGTSPYTTGADVAVIDGAVWVGAAGNENEKYRIGPLTDTDSDGIIEIDGTQGTWVRAPGGALDVRFRWSDEMGLATTDIDLVAWDEQGKQCGRSDDPQDGVGSHPLEAVRGTCDTNWVFAAPIVPEGAEHALAAALLDGGPDQLVGYLYGTSGLESGAATGGDNLTLPGDTRFGVSVGACSRVTQQAPDYSSRGPTDDGRSKPDVCAPTAVSTETYGTGRFGGSSAAAPHVAGLAALVVDAGLADDPAGVREWLQSHASDLGAPGPDLVFGAGAISAGTPPTGGCGCATHARPSVAAAGGMFVLVVLGAALRRCACPTEQDQITRRPRRYPASGCSP